MALQGPINQQPTVNETERRKYFIEQMELKLTRKLAARHLRRQLLRARLQKLRQW